MELGDINSKVQGVDYAYTLQGWLKGVNGQNAGSANDIGQDAQLGNPTVAQDAYAYSLGYYSGDYAPIGGSSANAFSIAYTSNTGDITGQSLYNGNISNSVLSISAFTSGTPVGYTYHYDQLNRLKNMRQHTSIGTMFSSSSITNDYLENATYDGNGNILTYLRNGAAATNNQSMDNLTYNYSQDANSHLTSNKLQYIHDAVAVSTNDLANQTNTANYVYDATGNLTKDVKNGLTNVTWNVYNKILTIANASGTMTYAYDAAMNRVSKSIPIAGSSPVTYLGTYYVRDAQGNTLAVYDNANSNINLREQTLYGSSRLGIWAPNAVITAGVTPYPANTVYIQTIGYKFYELNNHLGNVLTTITDRRIQNNSGSTPPYLLSDIATAQDYYPFGMLMPNRQFTANATTYRYGFNGKENDNEPKGLGNQQNYGERIYDPRVGKFLSTDPIASSYPMLTPYQFASNRPIDGIDLDGREYGTIHVNAFSYLNDNATTYTYTQYDPGQSNIAGPLGKGVLYDITVHYKNSNGVSGSYTYKHFTPRAATTWFGAIATDYGIFYGATPVLKVNKYGDIKTNLRDPNNNLDLPGVDAVDQGGRFHDHGYDRLNAIGKSALFNDWGTTPVDQVALNTWVKFLRTYKVGDKDPLGTAKVTKAEYDAASNGATLFYFVVQQKLNDIAVFIAINYKQAKQTDSDANTIYNYNMFLQIYLQKDKDGNYIRNDAMWNVDGNGNYTPKRPTQ